MDLVLSNPDLLLEIFKWNHIEILVNNELKNLEDMGVIKRPPILLYIFNNAVCSVSSLWSKTAQKLFNYKFTLFPLRNYTFRYVLYDKKFNLCCNYRIDNFCKIHWNDYKQYLYNVFNAISSIEKNTSVCEIFQDINEIKVIYELASNPKFQENKIFILDKDICRHLITYFNNKSIEFKSQDNWKQSVRRKIHWVINDDYSNEFEECEEYEQFNSDFDPYERDGYDDNSSSIEYWGGDVNFNDGDW